MPPTTMPPATMPACDHPPVRPRCSFGTTVATSPPIALETGWLNTEAATSSAVNRRADSAGPPAIASPEHTALATLNTMTHVRRLNPTSTTGAHRKYQIDGAWTIAAILAM